MKSTSLEDQQTINNAAYRQVKMIQDATVGRDPKSDCCHATVATYQLEDVLLLLSQAL